MQINWINDKIEAQLQDRDYLLRKYDEKFSRKLSLRLIEIDEAENYCKLPQGSGAHSIKKGNRFEYFAMDLPSIRTKRGKYRLAFVPEGDYDLANQSTIKSVTILGIVNYH